MIFVTIGSGCIEIVGGVLNVVGAGINHRNTQINREIAEATQLKLDSVMSQSCVIYEFVNQPSNDVIEYLLKDESGNVFVKAVYRNNKNHLKFCPDFKKGSD